MENPENHKSTGQGVSKRRLTVYRVVALLLVAGLSVLIFYYREQARALAVYGYPGIFLLAVLTNATVLLPVPGNLVVYAMGAVFNPLGVALAAGFGAAVGELSGYLAGFGGRAVVENRQRYEQVKTWLERHRKLADLSIFVLSAIPNPFFDMAGMAAGVLKIPVWRFLLFCSAGKILNMLLFAYLGSISLKGLE